MTTIAIPTAPAELEEWLHDGDRMKNVLAEGAFPEFIKNYQTAVAKKDPDIRAEVREQIQLGFAEWMKASGAKDDEVPPVDLTPGPAATPRIQGIRSSAHRALTASAPRARPSRASSATSRTSSRPRITTTPG